MAELLLELLSEEIPARMQARAAEDLKRLVTEKLKAASLTLSTFAAKVVRGCMIGPVPPKFGSMMVSLTAFCPPTKRTRPPAMRDAV